MSKCARCVCMRVCAVSQERLYLFQPLAELTELESARARDVSNTNDVRDGLVLVRALRQQRSCCERCDSNIYAHNVVKSGAETRLPQRMGNVDSERCSTRGVTAVRAAENPDTRAHAHAQTAILHSLRPHTRTIFSPIWGPNQYTFVMLCIATCQSKLYPGTRQLHV